MIKLENISYSYGKSQVLYSVSVTAEQGSCIVIAGPNGSGKSTLLSVIAGIKKQSAGTAYVNGKIGYVPQSTALFEDLSVKENLKFFAAAGKIKFCGTEKLPFKLKNFENKKVAKLSDGMKKRVSIACALISNPDILILDEPCSSLDIIYRDELLSLIIELKKQRKLIVFVGHDFNEITHIYDAMLLIKDGKAVFYKSKDELSDSPEKLEKTVRNALEEN